MCLEMAFRRSVCVKVRIVVREDRTLAVAVRGATSFSESAEVDCDGSDDDDGSVVPLSLSKSRGNSNKEGYVSTK